MPLMRLRCGLAVKLEIDVSPARQAQAEMIVQQFLGTLVMYGEAYEADAAKVEQIMHRSFGMNVTTNSVQLTFHD